MKYTILYGSVRSERQGINAARFFENQLKEQGHSATLIDPLEYPLPLLDKMRKEYTDDVPEMLKQLSDILSDSDGFIVVTGEYNHSIPPALKNIMDHFQSEYFFKPSAIVSYSVGSFGGVRAAVHLRAILGELGTPSISSMFPVPKVHEAFDENGKAIDEAYVRRSGRFLEELHWYTEAMKTQRAKGTPY